MAYVLVVVAIIIGVVVVVGAARAGELTSENVEATLAASMPDYLIFIMVTAYFALAVTLSRTTLGKRLFRLYVVRTDGSRLGFGRSLARSLAQVISTIPLCLGFVMIGLRADKRGLHDLICDTQVVRIAASRR